MINWGTSNKNSSKENAIIRIANMISIIAIVMSLAYVAIGILNNHITSIYIDSLDAVLFAIPLGLNYYKKYKTSMFFVNMITLFVMISGVILFDSSSYLKYGVIIPVALSFIFFPFERSWRFYIPLSTAFIFMIFAEFSSGNILYNPPFTFSMPRGIHDSIFYLSLVLVHTVTTYYFSKNLFKYERELLVYKMIFDNTNEGIALFDKEVRYCKENKAYEKLLGYTPSELKGKQPSFHLSDETFDKIEESLIKTGTFQGEIISDSNFGKKYLDLNIFSIPPIESQQTHFIGIKRDITERKTAEERLKENEARLAEINKTKDKFFSIIAHDLRNPFNSLLGFSNLLMEEVEKYKDSDIKMYSEVINRNLDFTMSYINNLLEWSRLQTKTIHFKRELSSLSVLTRRVLEILNLQAQKKNISIVNSIPKDSAVYVDVNMINSVLMNLISNAIKFTHENGQIEISCLQNSQYIEVSVKDNGVGITKENAEKLFKIEESVTSKGTKNEKGSGLGLILCKEFINLHKGEIGFNKNYKQGSHFWFRIPAQIDQ